jgi:hypothetical protein
MAATARVQVHWVPGHHGIEGNKKADQLAKAGAALPEDKWAPPTIAGIGGLRKAKIRTQFSDWWVATAPTCRGYRDLGLAASLACPKELDLPRPVLHNLLAARSGHGDFDWYHRRFKHKDNQRCSCGRLRAPEHLIHCRKTKQLQQLWPVFKPNPKTPRDYWLRLIASPTDFAAFLKTTRFFETICPPSLKR